METPTYESKSAYSPTDSDTSRTSSSNSYDDKAHYAADDDINWDAWWGEYIESME